MTISFPSDTKSIKDSIRTAVGQTATFVLQSATTACPECSISGGLYYDEVNNVSLNQYCTTCSGAYWIDTDSTTDVIAHVRWKTGDESDYGPAGYSLIGDVSVTIASDALTSEQLSQIKEIIIDSRKVKPYRTIYRGAPTRDRIRFTCRESEKE